MLRVEPAQIAVASQVGTHSRQCVTSAPLVRLVAPNLASDQVPESGGAMCPILLPTRDRALSQPALAGIVRNGVTPTAYALGPR